MGPTNWRVDLGHLRRALCVGGTSAGRGKGVAENEKVKGSSQRLSGQWPGIWFLTKEFRWGNAFPTDNPKVAGVPKLGKPV
jgi:hypothetical protein